MHPSSFPQMAAAVFATALAMVMPHTDQAPTATAIPRAAAPSTGFSLVGTSPISTRLAPDTPGCEEMGLSGRMPTHRQVADWLPRAGGPKQEARPRQENPVDIPQTLRPAMHMCVVQHFDPADASGLHKTVYHL